MTGVVVRSDVGASTREATRIEDQSKCSQAQEHVKEMILEDAGTSSRGGVLEVLEMLGGAKDFHPLEANVQSLRLNAVRHRQLEPCLLSPFLKSVIIVGIFGFVFYCRQFRGAFFGLFHLR